MTSGVFLARFIREFAERARTGRKLPPLAKVTTEVSQIERWVTKYGPDVLTVLIVLVVAWFLAAWAKRAVRKTLDRANFDLTAAKFFSNIARWSILAMAVVISLSRFGIETATFAALIAALGLALGLALQGTLSHLASGVMLLIFRPFKIGDSIAVAGQSGVVNELDLFTTSIDTADGRRVIIPNGQIFGNTIENQSHHPRRRTDVSITLSGSHDPELTRRVLLASTQGTPGVLMDPLPDVILLDMPGGNALWSVQAWGKTSELGSVRQALLKNLRETMKREGLGGPRQMMDVNVLKMP
jgi:small conductance mechanosensitive channel